MDMVLSPMELRLQTPNEGVRLGPDEVAQEHSERVVEYLLKSAAAEGSAMIMPDFTPNTHMALALAEIGRDDGEQAHGRLHSAIFSAYFERGLDIGMRSILLEIAVEQGFERSLVEQAWDTKKYDDRLGQFRKFALDLGVSSTPAALICNELLIGVRPYQILREAVDRCMERPA